MDKENLPDNTLDMQLAKIEEEVQECIEKSGLGLSTIDEIADVFIATAGVGRFKFDLALKMIVDVLTGMPCTVEELTEEVGKKLKILKTRKYRIINGVYHHETLQ